MVLNLFEKSVFFNAYIKEKHAIDAAIAKAAQEAASKISLKEAFSIAGSSNKSYRKAA